MIEPIWNTVVTQYVPDEKGEMQAVKLRNVNTHEERELPVACVFVAIGHDPEYARLSQANWRPIPRVICSLGIWPRANIPEFSSPAMWPIAFINKRSPPPASGCAAAIEAERYLSDLER